MQLRIKLNKIMKNIKKQINKREKHMKKSVWNK